MNTIHGAIGNMIFVLFSSTYRSELFLPLLWEAQYLTYITCTDKFEKTRSLQKLAMYLF